VLQPAIKFLMHKQMVVEEEEKEKDKEDH